MIRRPPRSTRTDTLFPYTTLFRSTRAAGRRRARDEQCLRFVEGRAGAVGKRHPALDVDGPRLFVIERDIVGRPAEPVREVRESGGPRPGAVAVDGDRQRRLCAQVRGDLVEGHAGTEEQTAAIPYLMGQSYTVFR